MLLRGAVRRRHRGFTVSGIRNGTYRAAVTGHAVTAAGGQISFNVRGNPAGIYALDGPGKIGPDGAFPR